MDLHFGHSSAALAVLVERPPFFFSIKRMNEIFWKCFQLGRVFQLPPLSEENEITFSRRRHNYTIGGINDGACELCAAFSHCSFPLSSLMAIKCYSLEKKTRKIF